METCLICGYQCKAKNALTRHISAYHAMSYKEYYDSNEKRPEEGVCIICGNDTAFTAGTYRKCCSNSCRTKLSWVDADDRRQAFSDNMMGNAFSVGRPAGSKNMQPYPVDTEVFRNKIAMLNKHNKESGHWIKTNSGASNEKRKKTWADKTDEEITRIMCSRCSSFTEVPNDVVLTQKTIDRLNELFGI